MSSIHERERAGARDWATVPNAITVARLVLFMPLITWLILSDAPVGWTLGALVLFGATDWIDGFTARRLDQTSRLGEILDPLADRVGIVVILAALTIVGYMPWYVVAAILVCDVVLGAIGLGRMDRVRAGRVAMIGKVRTAAVMVAIPARLLAVAADDAARGVTRAQAAAGGAAECATACCTASGAAVVATDVLLAVCVVLHVVTAVFYAVRYLRRH